MNDCTCMCTCTFSKETARIRCRFFKCLKLVQLFFSLLNQSTHFLPQENSLHKCSECGTHNNAGMYIHVRTCTTSM